MPHTIPPISTPLRVALFFGGRSAEHEVSLQSGRSIALELAHLGHTVLPIGIMPTGVWKLYSSIEEALEHPEDPVRIRLSKGGKSVTLLPDYSGKGLLPLEGSKSSIKADILFPIIHGTQGEDGSLQGLFEMSGLPFVGSGVLGAAAAMDKVVMKQLMVQAEIPTPKFVWFYADRAIDYVDVLRRLDCAEGDPVFVKPASLGSSVGISKVTDARGYQKALEQAQHYDQKIIVEEGITGRELEVSILGNHHPFASLAGEIISHRGFYDYEAKYVDPQAATLKVPTELEPTTLTLLQELGCKTFLACNALGMARVDLFLRASDNTLLVNEINTFPGFTKISQYPKLWAVSGVPYGELLNRLMALGIEMDRMKRHLSRSYGGNGS